MSTKAPLRIGFLLASVIVLACMVAGQAIGILCERFPPTQALSLLLRGDRIGAHEIWAGVPGSIDWRGWIFVAFLAALAAWLFVQRRAIARFFRTMQVGVTLVAMTTLSVTAGVLVPQIEGFEDPDVRVGAVDSTEWEQHYQTFRFAEGYFLYHLLRPYGFGMPDEQVPDQALASLERFGRRYGEEEQKNRQKLMEAAFRGPAISQAIEDFCVRHEGALKTGFQVATALDLNRAYKSHWFATLLGMLFVAVLFNTFRVAPRRWFSFEKIGFFCAHVGMMTLLAGGLVSKLATDRGILHLDLRDRTPQDTYYRHFTRDKQARMPFGVRLDSFGREDWKQIEVYFQGDDFTSRVPQYTLWPDRPIGLDFAEEDEKRAHPQLSIRVRELSDHAQFGTAFLRESYDPEKPSDVYPYAELEVAHAGEGGAAVRERELFTPLSPRSVYFDPNMAFRLRVAYGAGLDQDPEQLFPAPGAESIGTLLLSLDGQGELDARGEPFQIGSSFDLPGGWRVVVDRAVGRFELDPRTHKEVPDPRPLAEQPPEYPGVWLQIHPPDGKPPAERLMLDRVDWVEQGLQNRMTYPQVRARFEWDYWNAPGPGRFVLCWSLGGQPVLVGQDGTRREIAVGDVLPLERGDPVKLLQLVHKADIERNINLRAPEITGDGWDASFYSDDPRGVELEVVRSAFVDGESREEWRRVVRLAEQPPYDFWEAPDKSFVLRFFENDRMLPYEWRSVLSIVERDNEGKPYVVPLGAEREREIRVNDYFQYRGYRFFQTNADAEIPTYSGIGVVWDPGIPIVLLGMYVVIAGTALAFLVRPIVRARRRVEAA